MFVPACKTCRRTCAYTLGIFLATNVIPSPSVVFFTQFLSEFFSIKSPKVNVVVLRTAMSGLEVPAFLHWDGKSLQLVCWRVYLLQGCPEGGQRCRDVSSKLGIDKTCLLVWGDEIGILDMNLQHSRLHDEGMVTLLVWILA